MTRRAPDVADVLVVGGGPAGSTVAGLLAASGWRVTVLDRARFPRPKACGECINPGGVAALRRLELLDAVEALDPVEIRGWDVETGGGRTARGRFGPDVGPGLAVERSRLDRALLDRARERGARVEEGVRVTSVRPGGAGRRPAVSATLPDGGGTEREARVVVGADGLRSVTARALGAPAARPRHRKLSLTLRLRGSGPPADRGRLVLTSAGTVGLAPVGPSLWNATVVVDAGAKGREVARDPAGFARAFLGERVGGWSEPPCVVGGPWGSGNFDFRVDRIVTDGVLLVGDAAGYYDPLTGQGIFRALRSAELAALAIDTALREDRVSERGMEEYATRLRSEFGPGRRIQRLVESVVSRPVPRELAVGRLGSASPSMDALVRVTGDARPARTLLHPAVWWPALVARERAGSRSHGSLETPARMRTIDETITTADPDRAFRAAADVERWPDILPHYRWVRFRRKDGFASGVVEMAAWRHFGPVGWPTWWMSEMEHDPDARTVTYRHVDGITRGMDVVWEVVPREDGGTLLRIVHEWDGPRWPLVGGFAADAVIGPHFVSHIAGRTLAGVARAAESMADDRSAAS